MSDIRYTVQRNPHFPEIVEVWKIDNEEDVIEQRYISKYFGRKLRCGCPASRFRKGSCKHQMLIDSFLKNEKIG